MQARKDSKMGKQLSWDPPNQPGQMIVCIDRQNHGRVNGRVNDPPSVPYAAMPFIVRSFKNKLDWEGMSRPGDHRRLHERRIDVGHRAQDARASSLAPRCQLPCQTQGARLGRIAEKIAGTFQRINS
jgi:hypothetical protein